MKSVMALCLLAALGCKDRKSAGSDGESGGGGGESGGGQPGSSSSQATPTAIDAPTTSSDGAVVAKGDAIYWIAGTTGRPDSLVRRFSVTSKTWERLAAVTQPRLNLAAVTAGERIIAVGGMVNVGKHSNVIESYDDASHQWQVVGHLPEAVSSPAIAAVGDTVYVFGGNRVLNSSMRNYDAASVDLALAIGADNKVVTLAPMPTPREESTAVTVDGKIHVIGGRTSTSGDDSAIPPRTNVIEIYDPATNTWSEGPRMPQGGSGHAALLGKQLVFFGDGALNPDRPFILDFEAREWKTGEPRDSKTIGSTVEGVAVIADKLYVVTQVLRGIGQSSTPHIFEYAPATDTWTKIY